MKRTKGELVQYDITNAGASRALYQGVNEMARMQVVMETSNGKKLEVEMDASVARKMIQQMVDTYNIINPKLKI